MGILVWPRVQAYGISNENEDRLIIKCGIGYSENGELTLRNIIDFNLANGEDLSPSDNNTVKLLIDGNAYWIPESVGWRNDDNDWHAFRKQFRLPSSLMCT
ncbi:hypothetical protein [Oceanisphaera sp.]|uniref:hypothetical protein n=1 Tax=Oceanisphaera sp. TaxID=1929979 RepID=UPI003A9130F1